jgi:molecular chaperone DnaK (HSP70)
LGKIIGIDLGTSNSAAGSIVGGKCIIIPAAEGSTTGGKAFPSIVAFTREGDLLVGFSSLNRPLPFYTVIMCFKFEIPIKTKEKNLEVKEGY